MSSKKFGESSKRRKFKPSGFEEWGGYMAAKKMKLGDQFAGRKAIELIGETETEIFKGISIFVNGYTKPPADELKRLMLIHGGNYHHYYSRSHTTHVIASNLPKSKMKDLKTKVIVTANWVTDSIKEGKLLSYQKYLLYTPEVIDKQTRLEMENYLKGKSESSSAKQNSPNKSCNKLLNLNEISENNLSSNFKLKTTNHVIPVSKQNVSTYPMSESKQKATADEASVSPQKGSIAVKAGHPEFLTEFYNNSRLHHISTAGQELKRYVQYLVENNTEKHFPKREKLKEMSQQKLHPHDSSWFTSEVYTSVKNKEKHVMHLDMDCFFVSVGLKKHPELKGVPVAVTHSKGKRGGPQDGSDINYEASFYTNESKKRINGLISSKNNETSDNDQEKPKISMYSKEYGSLSEIASCSYEARKAGVHNGMFLGEALRRCPNLQTIPYDFEGYSEVSKKLYDIVASYTLDIEAVSCDELYLDCTELLQDIQLSPCQFSSVLRAEIEKETGCTASAGMGSNMLLARLANKVAKPNGQHYVHDSNIEKFMKKQKVGDLPGVGYTFTKKLQSLNVKTCGDLQMWPLSKLQQEFGPKTGQALFHRCRGKDDRIVQCHKHRKSVSAEINYGIRFETDSDVHNFISELACEVQNRVQNIGCKGKSVTLKLMVRKSDAPVETAKFMGHGVCDHFSKSVLLKSATDSSRIISKECCIIARSLKIKPQDYRGIGIQLSKLEYVQREKQNLKGFLNPVNKESSVADMSKDGVFSPKKLKVVNKPIPEKSTIMHFLSNKPSSSSELPNNTNENTLEQGKSFRNQLEPHSKSIDESRTIKHFLSSKTPTFKLQSFDVTKFLPEQLDQSVLEALPEDLRKEIIESCNTKTIQSSENSGINNFSPHPATSFTTEQHQVSETTCTTLKKGDSNHSIVSNKFYTDSPKLDESVLNALPEDLRKEILESCKKMTIQRSENSGISNFTQRISTSSMIKQHKDSHHSTDSNKLYADSPELDESVLNALPEDLKMEVLASYHDLYKKDYPAITTTKQQTSSFPSTSNQNQSFSISSESKQIPSTSLIPSISRENQSLIKSDTGLNKISTGEATASNVSSTFLCRLQGILSSQPEDVKLEVLKKYAPSTCNESFTPNSESSFKMGTSQLPNLGGAVKLDDVRNLLKEWIQSTEEPLEEDINDVKKYLIELVNVNLSNVKILLKFLHRMGSKGNEKWKKVYLIILSCLQEKVELKYSVRLEMETNFSL